MSSHSTDNGRVFDAPSGNWVYRVLPRAAWPYAQLARWDRPIGWQLLMWPCFWSAALAANAAAGIGHAVIGQFAWHLFLFFIGAVAMRGAGCTYNDLVDQDIDMQVARTRSRPLPSGRASSLGAKIFLVVQALVGLGVLLCFNGFTIVLGILSLALVAIYPFAKRFTNWPQFFLGMAFSWGALMGWAAVFSSISVASVTLYLAAICWTIGYDTIYAHQDKEDDAIVGVRSTARLFGDSTKIWLLAFFAATVLLAAISFVAAGIGFFGWLGLVIAAFMFGYQLIVLDIRDAAQCLELFKFNHVVGAVIFAGLAIGIPFAG
ncbi:MAG: 4-hydroxybenzoate polyprenyl transferase [Rhizobium sp.]|nr:4-hydroxybenzoate polyprenyl transferase [Rhizobium sp.]